jgi:hypothetical protein
VRAKQIDLWEDMELMLWMRSAHPTKISFVIVFHCRKGLKEIVTCKISKGHADAYPYYCSK